MTSQEAFAKWLETMDSSVRANGQWVSVLRDCWNTSEKHSRRAGIEAAAKVMDDKADHCLQLAEDAPRKEAVWHTRRKEALMYEGAAAAIRAEP